MKMGTIASPWRYDVAASSPLQLAILRYSAIEHDTSWIARYVGVVPSTAAILNLEKWKR
jgi:hypothetical protein